MPVRSRVFDSFSATSMESVEGPLVFIIYKFKIQKRSTKIDEWIKILFTRTLFFKENYRIIQQCLANDIFVRKLTGNL